MGQKCKILECCTDFANLLFCIIWACLPILTKINSINLQESLTFVCMQKINLIPYFFFEILQRLQNNIPSFFEILQKLAILGILSMPGWPVKMILSAYRKLRCMSSYKNSSISLTSFLKYYKDIANLLFWILWGYVVTPTKRDSTNLARSDWSRTFWIITPEQEFYQTRFATESQ